MTDYEDPDYSITEFILCGTLLGVSICYFIYAGVELYAGKRLDAIEAAGIGLFSLGGSADPLKYLMDSLTFPISCVEQAGRDTLITRIATLLGLSMWLIGLGGSFISKYL